MGANTCSLRPDETFNSCLASTQKKLNFNDESGMQNGEENIDENLDDEIKVMQPKVLKQILHPFFAEHLQALTSPKKTLSRNQCLLNQNFEVQGWVSQWVDRIGSEGDGQRSLSEKTMNEALINYKQHMRSLTPKFKEIVINDENFVKMREDPIGDYYEMKNKVGEGAFGSVYEGVCKKTGEKRAIKVLKMNSMKKKNLETLKNEINILKKMDHINIIKIYDIFCYNNFFYVVMEFCQGGDLLSAFKTKKLQDERIVKIIFRQIMSAIYYMNSKGVIHRDMKLENLVLVEKIDKANEENLCIKIIDFGLAAMVNRQDLSHKCGQVGTLSFMAPEIFKGEFCFQSDIWSCGIILCILLSGTNPFKDKKMEKTRDNIINKNVEFLKNPAYKNLSEHSRNLLSKMLYKNPFKRISSERILQHPFVKEGVNSCMNIERENQVIHNITKFTRGSNFTCFIKNFMISKNITQSQRQEMALIFEKIDSDGSGVIDKKELEDLYRMVTGINWNGVEKYLKEIDQNQSNKIDFHEFLLVMANDQIYHNKCYLQEAFEFFDSDKTGFIEKEQIMECLVGCDEQEIISILEAIDFNNDGKISMDEFCQYMMSA